MRNEVLRQTLETVFIRKLLPRKKGRHARKCSCKTVAKTLDKLSVPQSLPSRLIIQQHHFPSNYHHIFCYFHLVDYHQPGRAFDP